VTIGSVVIDLPHALLTVAREVRGGGFRPRVVALGAAESVVTWGPNPRLAERIPAGARATIDSIGALIRAGRFDPLAEATADAAPAPAGAR
jgi:hypothetical protein